MPALVHARKRFIISQNFFFIFITSNDVHIAETASLLRFQKAPIFSRVLRDSMGRSVRRSVSHRLLFRRF